MEIIENRNKLLNSSRFVDDKYLGVDEVFIERNNLDSRMVYLDTKIAKLEDALRSRNSLTTIRVNYVMARDELNAVIAGMNDEIMSIVGSSSKDKSGGVASLLKMRTALTEKINRVNNMVDELLDVAVTTTELRALYRDELSKCKTKFELLDKKQPQV